MPSFIIKIRHFTPFSLLIFNLRSSNNFPNFLDSIECSSYCSLFYLINRSGKKSPNFQGFFLLFNNIKNNNGDGNSGSTHDKECVRVAVNFHPLITPELILGCTNCIIVFLGEPQVQIGSHSFTFDYVFGNGGTSCSRIFDECVAPLVDALFKGYNETVKLDDEEDNNGGSWGN